MATDTDILRPPTGMRDFPPAEMRVRNHIFAAFEEAARRFAFEPFDGPVVEHFELYHRKAGGEAEELQRQIYDFETRPDDEEAGTHLALRPEMTPTLARMIVQEQASLPRPVRWWSLPQCFRYERAQRGRKREHYQWNLDVCGQKGVQAECEVLACAMTALQLLGLGPDEVVIRYNSRELLREALTLLSIPNDRHLEVLMVVDKKEKIEADALTAMLADLSLSETQIERLHRFLDLGTVEAVRNWFESEGGTPGTGLETLATFEREAAPYGLGDWLSFDLGIVRGLAYYTGIVFEAFARGELREECPRALFGGGRYGDLLSDLGGQPMTAVGLGFGDVVLTDLLHQTDRIPPHIEEGTVGLLVVGKRSDDRQAAIEAAAMARKAGRSTLLALERKMKKVYRTVERRHVRHILFVEAEAWSRGEVTIRDAQTREERPINLNDWLLGEA